MTQATPRGVVWASAIFIFAVAVYMLVPLLIVVASSLSSSEFLVFPPPGLSLR